ncbi:unnamed protein product [Calypogeia fissa]
MEVFASVEMFADAGPLFFEEFFSGYGEDFMEVCDGDNVEDTHDSARVVLGEGISNAPADTEDMQSGGIARPVLQLQKGPLAGDTIPGKLDVDSNFLAKDMDNGGTPHSAVGLDGDTGAGQLVPDSEDRPVDMDLGRIASPVSQLDDVPMGALGLVHIGNVSPTPQVCNVDAIEETTGAGLDIVLSVSEIDVTTAHSGVSKMHEVILFNPATTNVPGDTTNVDMEPGSLKMTDLVQGLIAELNQTGFGRREPEVVVGALPEMECSSSAGAGERIMQLEGAPEEPMKGPSSSFASANFENREEGVYEEISNASIEEFGQVPDD